MRVLMIGLIVSASLLTGCQTTGKGPSVAPSANVERLIKRPDAEAAKKAAPEWVRDALKTINGLEAEIMILKLRGA